MSRARKAIRSATRAMDDTAGASASERRREATLRGREAKREAKRDAERGGDGDRVWMRVRDWFDVGDEKSRARRRDEDCWGRFTKMVFARRTRNADERRDGKRGARRSRDARAKAVLHARILTIIGL